MDTTSFWLHSEGRPTTYPSIDRDLSVDVVVIGGGMTGVTTAYLLTTAGLKVALVERGRCGHGETSRTTAHLTAVTDARLSELVERLGTDHGRAVWDAGFAALSEIQSIVEHEGIACGFEHTAGYLVGRLDASPDDHSQIEDLRREALCAADAGFEARFVDSVPGLKRPGIRYEYQAKFHPLKYLHALLDRSAERGCQIFEESQVEEVKTEPLTVVVGGHVISTGRVIVATHVPIVGGTNVVRAALLETDLYPYSSYVVRARIRKGRIPCGMFWDMASPYFYLRVDDGNNEDYAIFGGADHKTGQVDNPEERYGMVEGALHALVPEAAITERWSGQIIETRDGLPYIGETAPNQFAITGFSGNGITFGTVGAIMMRDAALGIRNPWTGLFDIQRTLVTRGLWDYVSENKDYPYYMIRDRFRKADGQSLDSLARGEGKLLDIDGRRVAAYRADDGRVTMLSPHCTHLGCVVTWNGAESTWDCPCHGSRFRATGDVMGGPAEAPLAPVAALAPVKH